MSESLTVMKLVHDLKMPLGALKILELESNLSPDYKRILQLSTSFLESLIVKASPPTLSFIAEEQIEEIVRDVIEEKRLVWTRQIFELSIKGVADKTHLHKDKFGLRRILENVIENAVQAHARHRVTSPLKIELSFSKTRTAITCRDFGPGMRPGSNRKFGWGLGLSMIREISAQNGWSFKILSRAGFGTWAILILD